MPPKKAPCAGGTGAVGSHVQIRCIVRKKKPVDPVRQAQKNRAHRIGWLIALAGIVVGFALVLIK